MEIGDLAERDPFYLLKSKKKVKEDPVMKFFSTDPDLSPSVDQKKVKKVASDSESDDYDHFLDGGGDDSANHSVDS